MKFELYCTQMVECNLTMLLLQPLGCTAVQRRHCRLVPLVQLSSLHHAVEELDQFPLVSKVGVSSEVLVTLANSQVFLVLTDLKVACLAQPRSGLILAVSSSPRRGCRSSRTLSSPSSGLPSFSSSCPSFSPSPPSSRLRLSIDMPP